MNAQTTVALALALLMQNGTVAADDVRWETNAIFVREGDARSAREIGDEWAHKQGALVCGGTGNYLVAGKATGAGDFRIRARLSLQQLDATAASLVIGGNHFGFDGQSKKFFVEGPDWGPTRLLRDARRFIAPGKPFEVEVARRGETLSYRIDGIEVHAGKYRLASTCAIGLRPWRGTMRVYDFSASGDLKPVTETTIRAMQHDFRTGSSVTIGGVRIDPALPPDGLTLHREPGILAAEPIRSRIIHRSDYVWVPRATVTPSGDYLILFPEGKGQWYQGERMLTYRSSDRGKTWVGPSVAFDASQSHHGFVPLIPRGSKRIYAFGTQPIPGMVGDPRKREQENCPIGFRYSDDDGHTWSEVTLIRPQNDPEFTGMSCVRMCETDAGTWLIGSHDGTLSSKPGLSLATRQYVLRSEDRGKTWQLLPKKRPDGWHLEEFDRMDEGTLVNLGGGNVLLATRTAEGHIWESRSDDDGRSWSDPKPTTLVHPDAPSMIFKLGDGKTLIALIHNRYDPKNPHFNPSQRNEVWCCISKDDGRTWSEPRFVFANAGKEKGFHSCSYIDMFADGPGLHLFLGHDCRQLLYLQFDESDIAAFLTKAELVAATEDLLAKSIQVGGLTLNPKSPPKPLVLRRSLGLVTAPAVDAQLVHEATTNLFETRATMTPRGDYLLMFPEGKHYGGEERKVNKMIAYRSSDKGMTWTGPTVAFDIDYSQHGFIPLIPRGSKRIYAFGTQPIEGTREGQENCPIGFRYSDDDGHTWSDVTLIRPKNDPDFKGMSVMRMCETDSGAWLVGSHEADWSNRPISTRQYVLRSEDSGKTWTVLPKPRPDGWYVKEFGRMDEGRPIDLRGGKVMLMARTCEGHLWASWSKDDGRTWSDPKPTPLIHPDAPPMLFHHPDGKTLVAFHHNRHSGVHFKSSDRSEIWVSLSKDQGRTWSEPRFVFANALAATSNSAWHDHQCSYLDALVDGDEFHVFVPHRWKRALHLTLKADDIERLPTQKDLTAVSPGVKNRGFEAGIDPFLGKPRFEMQQLFRGERFPNVVVATDGTVLATWGSKSIKVRRSEDGGKTWQPEITIADPGFHGGGALVDENTGDILVFVQDKHPPASAVVYRSKNQGRTWNFEDLVVDEDANGNVPSLHMSEHGVTLRHGEHAGRLLRPARVYQRPGGYNTAIYSDNGGKSWRSSGPFPGTGTGEGAVAELSNGHLYYSSRKHWFQDAADFRHHRPYAWSYDRGETWRGLAFHRQLPDGPRYRGKQRRGANYNGHFGMMCGLTRLPVEQQDILIYSNADNPGHERVRMTVWSSFDGGKTWPVKRLVYEGASAYSSLTAGRPSTPSEGWIYLQFEGGPKGGSTVARFNLSWILAGEKTGDGSIPDLETQR